MKKSFLLFVALFALVSVSFAQSGLKAAKKASRALSTYNLDTKANADKLTEAKDLIESAFEDAEVQNSSKALAIKGNIYSTIASNTVNKSILDPTAGAKADMTVGQKAFQAYKKAYETAEKKFEKKDAIKGLIALEPIMENLGIVAYQNKKWQDAYNSFTNGMELGEYLTSIGETSFVDDAKKEDMIVNAISVGAQEDSGVDLKPMLAKAIEMNIDNPSIYQIAYSTFEKTDKEKAVMYLNKGVEKYPEDTGLLFAQINYYIGEGKLELLIDKLKAAIATEPENASVHSTLASVYDQLYVKESDAGNVEKAEEYFQGALEYYGNATEIDPKSFNSYYGIGALYFNKAAKTGKELNDLGGDYSPEGIKKYDAKKAEMNSYYNESFPYLQKAEEIAPNDPLVLSALKEYYARTSKLDKAAEYKQKLEAATNKGN